MKTRELKHINTWKKRERLQADVYLFKGTMFKNVDIKSLSVFWLEMEWGDYESEGEWYNKHLEKVALSEVQRIVFI